MDILEHEENQDYEVWDLTTLSFSLETKKLMSTAPSLVDPKSAYKKEPRSAEWYNHHGILSPQNVVICPLNY